MEYENNPRKTAKQRPLNITSIPPTDCQRSVRHTDKLTRHELEKPLCTVMPLNCALWIIVGILRDGFRRANNALKRWPSVAGALPSQVKLEW